MLLYGQEAGEALAADVCSFADQHLAVFSALSRVAASDGLADRAILG